MLLVLGSGIAFAQQNEAATEPSGNDPSLGAHSEGIEVIADRTATSQTFRLPDGTLEAQIFEKPVNYRDADGQWMPIEEDLAEQADGSGLTNGANRFDLSLPERLGEAPVRLSVDGQWVSAELLGPSSEVVQIDGNTAIYEGSESGTSFELASVASGVKEDIELADASQPSSFDFALDASSGLTPEIAKDGSVEFHEAEGKRVVVLPAPTISDSASEGPSSAVHYELKDGSDGQWRLTVQADREWLQAPNRRFPVRIDPTLVVPGPSLDCTFGSLPAPEGWQGCGLTGKASLLASYSQTEGQPSRSLLRFDLSALPPDPYVTSATVKLFANESAQNTAAVQLRRVTQVWTQKMSWRYFDVKETGQGTVKYPWTTPGGDFTSEGAEILTSQRGSQSGWWNFSSPELTEVVRKWASGQVGNQGLLVKNSNESKAECESNPKLCAKRSVSFLSSAAGEQGQPMLSLTYLPPAPSTSKVLFPREGAQTARRLKLIAHWEDAATTGLTFQFRVTHLGGNNPGFATIPSNLIRNAKGEALTWPLAVKGGGEPQGADSEPLYFDAAHADPTLQAEGGTLQVRAIFDGSGASAGYSPPVNATVNRFLGGVRDATASVGPGSVDLMTGNYTVSRADVSIAVPGSALEFSRTHNSRDAGPVGNTGVLGRGWKPGVAVEVAGGAEWRSVREVLPDEEEKEEGLEGYAVLTGLEGYESAFEISGSNFVSPPEASGWILSREGSLLVLADSEGNRTSFEKSGSGAEYLPVSITQTGGAGNRTQMVYKLVGEKRRLSEVIAPSAAGVTCTESNATSELGCRALIFTYEPASKWGAPSSYGDRLSKIAYYGPAAVSQPGSWEVANYSYDSEGRLVSEWDPRISLALKETYTYKSGGQLATLTPPGQEPWTFNYNES
jgi:hypothetical protein